MTKEQKEAIEILNQLKEMCECLLDYREVSDSHYKIFKRRILAINIVLSMLKEKDKVIDLMSEQLTTPMHSKEWVKQYYENKAKE